MFINPKCPQQNKVSKISTLKQFNVLIIFLGNGSDLAERTKLDVQLERILLLLLHYFN